MVNFRTEVNNTIKVKFWDRDLEEPSIWDIDYTKSSNFSVTGNYIGFISVFAYAEDFYWDNFKVIKK